MEPNGVMVMLLSKCLPSQHLLSAPCPLGSPLRKPWLAWLHRAQLSPGPCVSGATPSAQGPAPGLTGPSGSTARPTESRLGWPCPVSPENLVFLRTVQRSWVLADPPSSTDVFPRRMYSP